MLQVNKNVVHAKKKKEVVNVVLVKSAQNIERHARKEKDLNLTLVRCRFFEMNIRQHRKHTFVPSLVFACRR